MIQFFYEVRSSPLEFRVSHVEVKARARYAHTQNLEESIWPYYTSVRAEVGAALKIPEVYANSEIILSMAGSGDPWSYLKPSSKLTLRALHDGYSLVDIQSMFQISEDDLLEKIRLLADANLVKKEHGKYSPAFLIVDAAEATNTFNHAKRFGRIIADELVNNLREIATRFSQLEISEQYTLHELSLVLVGSKILDIGLLEALARDRALLGPAPTRPSPNRPDAQYYLS